MKKDRQTTAAKAATNTNGGAQGAAKGNGTWRTTTRKGERVLIDPHGHTYHGTAQEIRDAALTPNTRKGLAQSIQWARHVAEHFKYTPEQRREYVREKRRDAIKTQEQFVLFGESTTIPADVEIVASAAARYMGQTFDAFVRDALFAAIGKAIDKAEKDAGEIGVGLPLTRYERAALDMIKATRPQIEAEAKARLAARATA